MICKVKLEKVTGKLWKMSQGPFRSCTIYYSVALTHFLTRRYLRIEDFILAHSWIILSIMAEEA